MLGEMLVKHREPFLGFVYLTTGIVRQILYGSSSIVFVLALYHSVLSGHLDFFLFHSTYINPDYVIFVSSIEVLVKRQFRR